MKKYSYILIVILGIIMFMHFVMSASAVVHPKTKSKEKIIIPDSLNMIFKNFCMGCHSSGRNMIAESHLNFSRWSDYKAKKQIRKADDICEMISMGHMPPKKAREAKPELIPTKAQINSICKWANSLKQKK